MTMLTSWLSRGLFLLLFWIPAAQAAYGSGNVDRVEYLQSQHSLIVAGWATSEKPNVFVTNLIVRLDDQQVYRGRMLRAERPDVAEATHRSDWLLSGFLVQIRLPLAVSSGDHKVEVLARLSSGHDIALSSASGADTVKIPLDPAPSTAAQWCIVLALLLPAGGLLSAARISLRVRRWWPHRQLPVLEPLFFGVAVGLSFVLLVTSGSTSSSLILLFKHSHITASDSKPWLGEARPVRSDEWEVITPMALSQATQKPKFPVLNKDWGNNGHNMLVVGMTGVPVGHVSTVAKPATWGFFFLDLRKALAWYWWFPFFACFSALWLVLRRFFGLDWKLAAGLSIAFVCAPYDMVFSGWPAYTAFFPLAVLLAVRSLLLSERAIDSIFSGVLLGISAAGFALILYPAWQVSLAYLLLPFTAAWCWANRKTLYFRKLTLLGLITATATATIILVSWWIDARDAVGAIQNTIYPGQRAFEAGGDIDPWYFIKGILSLQTIYRPTALMDSSDAGSFLFLPLALVVATAASIRSHKKSALCAVTLIVFAAAVIAHMFIGFGATTFRPPFWGLVTSYRLDLALALAQILLMGWLFSDTRAPAPASLPAMAMLTGIVTLLWGSWLYHKLPAEIASALIDSVTVLSLVGWAALGYLVVARKYVAATVMYCAWTLAISLPFNPLGQAPSHTELQPALTQALARATAQVGHAPTIAVIDERTWPLVLAIANWHVSNSVFYVPPLAFWKRLDPTGDNTDVYNRYQRLFFRLGAVSASERYTIRSPRLDEVVLTMDPLKFNFNKLGSDLLLSPIHNQEVLRTNSSLEYLENSTNWSLFRIKPQLPP